MSGKKPKKHDILPLLAIKKNIIVEIQIIFFWKKVATEHL